MALDRRNYKQLVETTEELAKKVGSSEIVNRIVEDLKDESEPYRKMVCGAVARTRDSLCCAVARARDAQLDAEPPLP